MDGLNEDEQRRAIALLADLERLKGATCQDCGKATCGHESVISTVLGFKDAVRCLACLAKSLGKDSREFRDHALAHIERRACFMQGWLWASKDEGFGTQRHPSCLWEVEQFQGKGQSMSNTPAGQNVPKADAEWDAGNLGCGDLVLDLRMKLNSMAPGQVLKVRALDPGAPEDLPAWCNLTGHTMLAKQHPDYWIKRRPN